MFVNCLLILVMSILTVFDTVMAVECSSKDGSFSITCPEIVNPPDFTKCCWNHTSVHCCPHHISPAGNSDNMVMITGLAIISACLTIALIIVVCCFWSRCLLFNMCRVNYTYSGDFVAYTKEEEALNSLPYEGGENCKTFSPVQVKIKPVQDI